MSRPGAELPCPTLPARHTARRNHLDFDSILVFSDQAEIPRMDLARLSDVGGDMVSSLASSEDLRRKVERRIG